ncbi:arsenite S-adenosylmethyltransferase [Pisolithus orientalis]|uniref:arsenite S-adenosylmethyltransferase n=1 Tax=Pisolithus orientalis TaxID=936130 RepID=UPI0022251002|nr:arsenite S-adenosylmethyltransferase [Pisolithus orientalis]KAI6030417.1 arsenite S-adenosylmethyltransferase [Pisolithus orientalis]
MTSVGEEAIDSTDPISCTRLIDVASVTEGETVLYLGCGTGSGVLYIAKRVGDKGQVIGIDERLDAIAQARRTATARDLRPPRVAFVHVLQTDELPVLSDSVDCVVSMWSLRSDSEERQEEEKLGNEIWRVVKPGGRVVLSMKDIPESLRSKLVVDAVYNHGSQPEVAMNDNKIFYRLHAVKPPRKEEDGYLPLESALRDWWTAYPAPVSEVQHLDCGDVANMMRNGSEKQGDYVVIDVRRKDHAGGHVRGSVQCPAQTFYDDLPSFYERFGEKKQVVFYCGSSHGRGPRCARWYQDYLNAKGDTRPEALVMRGGIKEWKERFGGDDGLTDRDAD